MNHAHILIVDGDRTSRRVAEYTLKDAGLDFTVVASAAAAGRILLQRGDVSLVILRPQGENARDDLQLVTVRGQSARPRRVLAVIDEDQRAQTHELQQAGADNVIVAPFEPRELRMLASIIPADVIQRIDAAHSAPIEFVLHSPRFCPESHKFVYDVDTACLELWQQDPMIQSFRMDTVIVCPECQSIPTMRTGCPGCGCAFHEEQTLLHHYACAHVAGELEFETADGLKCPKCLARDLVPGVDLEQLAGERLCHDCKDVFAEAVMIGHCLACEHRFEATAGHQTELIAWRVPVDALPDRAIAGEPEYRRSDELSLAAVSGKVN